jgi:signal transduction histidine kinase
MVERVPVHFLDHDPSLGLWADVHANPTPDGGIAVFFRDVTAEHQAELVRARNSEFEQHLIGIVSHDLRNPLHAVQLGASMLVGRSELNERARRTATRIQGSADRAVRLVNDLLDFTRARLGGGLPISPRSIDVHAVAHAVAAEVEVTYPERKVVFDQAGDGTGTGDPDRLAQAIENLLTNALKYSPPDTPVRLSSRAEAERIVIAIHNQGEPISDEVRANLFEPFKRGVHLDAASRSIGLGLYIVKQVVDAHGGTIAVSSTELDGTTFEIQLPRAGR